MKNNQNQQSQNIREYKFRAFHKQHKIMIYSEKTIGFDNCSFKDGKRVSLVNDLLKFDGNLIWMQRTGLKDMDGNDIYEGDFVECKHDIMLVSWYPEKATFCIKKSGRAFRHFFGEACDAKDCKVVGNKYENLGFFG